MQTPRILAVTALFFAITLSASACSNGMSKIDEATECLDELGVNYTVVDGVVVINIYANDDSEAEGQSAQARACMGDLAAN